MYTLQDYVVAIKRHYGRSKYRKLVSLYGIPYREIDTNSLPKRSASLAFKLNTRDQTFNRTSINIEVDSPTVVRVQVIKRSIWFIELIQRWYYFLLCGPLIRHLFITEGLEICVGIKRQ